MRHIPGWVDYVAAEQSAAVMARNLVGRPNLWETLIANAQAVVGSRTDERAFENYGAYGFDDWKDLAAAARILDLGATKHGVLEKKDRKDIALLAACAFGMAGTAVSATAVIDQHRLVDSELSDGEIVALALSGRRIAAFSMSGCLGLRDTGFASRVWRRF